mmetsp:Transcript_12197/g.21164  ORF Transcript_12197/g.21164 Transcript_12197/m.21164 type:complete len:205 (+) Transcript_12197:442-1056(+)
MNQTRQKQRPLAVARSESKSNHLPWNGTAVVFLDVKGQNRPTIARRPPCPAPPPSTPPTRTFRRSRSRQAARLPHIHRMLSGSRRQPRRRLVARVVVPIVVGRHEGSSETRRAVCNRTTPRTWMCQGTSSSPPSSTPTRAGARASSAVPWTPTPGSGSCCETASRSSSSPPSTRSTSARPPSTTSTAPPAAACSYQASARRCAT